MIFDRLDRASLYYSLHPHFPRAFEFLKALDPSAPAGRVDLAGDDLYVRIVEYATKPAAEKMFEWHRLYIDIQFVLSGGELMGFGPLSPAVRSGTAFNEERDVAVNADLKAPATWLSAGAGEFAVFFPDEPHMPGASPLGGPSAHIRKAVVKVRC